MQYIPIYKAQSTGRKTEVGGGFQSCSREMKHEAFAYTPGTRNYDLKSSQIYCLRYQFMACRLDYKVLDKYLKADKAALAKEIGVDKDTWKGINYGTYFGGFPTNKIKNIKIYNNDRDYGNLISLLSCKIVSNHICKFLGIETFYDAKRKRRSCKLKNLSVTEVLKKILNILLDFYFQNEELLEELEKWHKYLASDFPESSTYYSEGKRYIFNRSQMPIEITQYQNKKGKISREGIRKLASHLLQGQEAQFISRLTWYSQKYDDCPYKVMNDQHDGYIVLGEVTEKYVQMAREETKFFDAELIEKPYL